MLVYEISDALAKSRKCFFYIFLIYDAQLHPHKSILHKICPDLNIKASKVGESICYFELMFFSERSESMIKIPCL